MESIFSRLPESFFIPLASPNRRHYSALLLMYYRLFMEYRSSVERELVVAKFAEYFAGLDSAERIEDEGEAAEDPAAVPESSAARDPRILAGNFLRKLIVYGWMGEEEQLDFSRVITMNTSARPFFEAMDAVERGAAIEYESHIVAVYSSLCSDAAAQNGEHAVLNAHWHTRLLMESLKVLEQNIKSRVQEMFGLDAGIPEILHAHYDVYMQEVVDRAYTRLKTSDNLSRFRPRIIKVIIKYLNDEPWMARTAEKLATIQRTTAALGRERVREMLLEIRDELKGIDPILESIDDKNRRYSRISTERIRSRLHADSSLQGKIGLIVKAMSRGRSRDGGLAHHVYRLRYITRESLYTRRKRVVADDALMRGSMDQREAEIAAAELRLRIAHQLNREKIAEHLSRFCPLPGSAREAEEMVDDIDSYVRLLYAADYAESGDGAFPFSVDWEVGMVTVKRFRFRAHRFIRKYPDG